LWINDATGLAFRVIVLMAGHGPEKSHQSSQYQRHRDQIIQRRRRKILSNSPLGNPSYGFIRKGLGKTAGNV
jgi:hypothetical protein